MRYLLLIIAILIGPFLILAGIYTIVDTKFSSFAILVVLMANYWAWKEGVWDAWKPSVIKKFLENAKKAGL